MHSTAAASCAVQLRLELTFILDDKEGIPACTNTGFVGRRMSMRRCVSPTFARPRWNWSVAYLRLYWELSAHKRVVGARSIALRARLRVALPPNVVTLAARNPRFPPSFPQMAWLQHNVR